MNVHHIRWLKYSSSTSVEGSQLYGICLTNGFAQLVREPTREQHLLDLVLTDVGAACVTTVLPSVADHKLVLVKLAFDVPRVRTCTRELWIYKCADWAGLRHELAQTDWRWIDSMCPTQAAEELTQQILRAARRHIQTRRVELGKSSHPWLNERCLRLVRAKERAAGTEDYPRACAQCSAGIMEEYEAYIRRTRDELRELRRGSKLWWRKSRALLHKLAATSSIPGLKTRSGDWILGAKAKADLLAQAFEEKFVMIEKESNRFSDVNPGVAQMSGFLALRARNGTRTLRNLRVDSATGPDGVSTRILKTCASELGFPFAKLARRIIGGG